MKSTCEVDEPKRIARQTEMITMIGEPLVIAIR